MINFPSAVQHSMIHTYDGDAIGARDCTDWVVFVANVSITLEARHVPNYTCFF